MNTAFLGYHRTMTRGKIEQKRGSPQSALDEHSAGRGVAKLEIKLQSELDLPRIVRSIARGTNFAES
jgi:hypothetical protein